MNIEEAKFKFLKEFYISYRQEYIVMDKHKRIFTKKSNKSKDKSKGGKVPALGDWMIKLHLKQIQRIGIKFPKSGSNLIGLDIDTLEFSVLRTIYNKLLDYGIPDKSILLTSSGNKGYHCDVFIEKYIDRQTINDFYEILLHDTGYCKTEVELRGGSDQGYFLPLSINFKGADDYEKNYGYCGIVEEELGIMEKDDIKELKILQSKRKMNPNIIRKIIEEFFNKIPSKKDTVKKPNVKNIEKDVQKKVGKSLGTLKSLDIDHTNASDIVKQIKARRVLKQGTRHNNAFVFALALRDLGKNRREIYDELIIWHSNLESGYKSTEKEIVEDCRKICKSTFQKEEVKYKYNLEKNHKPFITKENIFKLAKIKNHAEMRVYMALAIHSNKFAEDDDKQFYMTYKQMKYLMNTQARNGDLLRYIKRLETKGFVQIISRNKRMVGEYKHKSNIYKMTFDKNKELNKEEKKYYLEEDIIKKVEMKRAIKKILTEGEYTQLVGDEEGLDKLLRCFLY